MSTSSPNPSSAPPSASQLAWPVWMLAARSQPRLVVAGVSGKAWGSATEALHVGVGMADGGISCIQISALLTPSYYSSSASIILLSYFTPQLTKPYTEGTVLHNPTQRQLCLDKPLPGLLDYKSMSVFYCTIRKSGRTFIPLSKRNRLSTSLNKPQSWRSQSSPKPSLSIMERSHP